MTSKRLNYPFKVRHNNTGPPALICRHFRKASLCKQTAYYHRTLSGQNLVSSLWASRLHCSFFSFFFISTNSSTKTNRDNQSNLKEKGAESLFFFFFRRTRRCMVALLPQCNSKKGSLTVLCPKTFRDRGQLVYNSSKDHRRRRKADCYTLKSDAHFVSGGVAKETIKNKTTYLLF